MPDMEETVPETGPEAILYALRQLDADKIEAEGRKELESGKKTKRSSAVKKLRIASGLRRNNMTPEAFMMKSVPVLPPKFRPFAVSGETLLMGDANILYKDLMDVRDAHEEERKMFGDRMAGNSRLALYDAVKSVYGYGDAVKPKTRAKDVQGYLRKIVGKTSKFSWMSNKMLAKPVDNVGRSTIIVDPELDMDHIGLPKDLAFTMYAPYIQRRLKQLGMRDAEALKAVKERTPYAEKALNDVVKERPVWYSRAPQWHRFSINAAYPKIIDAKAIAVPPAPCVGMGADFDGDQQIGTVVIAIDLQAIKGILPDFYEKYKNCSLQVPNPVLGCACNKYTDTMKVHTNTTVLSGKTVMAVDLADFPHTTRSNVRKDDKYDIEFYNVPDGVYVPAYDAGTHTVKWAPVKYWSIHRGKKVEIVNLENGAQIYTDDDPRAVYGIAADADDVVPHRFTPSEAVDRKVLVPVDRTASVRLASHEKYFNFETGELQDTADGRLTVPLDFDLGQLFGIMAGDGWCDKKPSGTFHVSDAEGYNAEFVLDYLTRHSLVEGPCKSETVFDDGTPGRYGRSVRHSFNGKGRSVICRAIHGVIGGDGDATTYGAGNKHMPVWYATAGKAFITGLVNGMIATDGSVSFSRKEGRSHDELMVSITSISLRLLREVKCILSMLGVKGTISFSKETIAGNTSWILTVCTVDAKREHLLDNCCHARKASRFMEGAVSESPAAVRLDYVPMPVCVYRAICNGVATPKVDKAYMETHAGKYTAEERGQRLRQASIMTTFRKEGKRGYVTRYRAGTVIDALYKADAKRAGAHASGVDEVKRLRAGGILTRDALPVMVSAVRSVYPDDATDRDYPARKTLVSRLRDCIGRRVGENLLDALEAHLSGNKPYAYSSLPEIEGWKRIVDSGLAWVRITSVEKTGECVTGYDLTVPGSDTFLSTDGVVLSNTINIHVPASDEAVKECRERLLPSSNPFKDRSEGQVMPLPKQEEILGLYTAATSPDKRTYDFKSEKEALHAIRSGEVPLSANVTINGKG